MKKQLVIVSALLFIICVSFSQNKFNLNINAGYSLPVADLRGEFPPDTGSAAFNFSLSKTLLTTSGFNIGTQFKFAVDSAGSQRLTAGLSYSSFSGSADYKVNQNASYKNKVSIFTLNAGLEYAINPYKQIVPFLGLDIAMNVFGGKIEGSGDNIVSLQRKSEVRIGVIATAGVDIRLWKNSGIIAGVKYGLTNLIGKSSEISTTSSITDAEEPVSGSNNEIPLNDKAVSSLPAKSINYVQFFLGVSIYFGDKLGKK